MAGEHKFQSVRQVERPDVGGFREGSLRFGGILPGLCEIESAVSAELFHAPE